MFFKATKLSLALLGSAFLLTPGAVEAQLVPDGPDCDWVVTYDGFNPTPLTCFGAYLGNPGFFEDEIRALLEGFAGPVWDLVGKIDSSQVDPPFDPRTDIDETSGRIYFNPPPAGVFALILKSATRFSIYVFDSYLGTTAPDFYVEFTTAGTSTNVQGMPQELSGVTLWEKDRVVVPEPSSLLLLGTGLLGLGFAGYRRRRD